MRVLLANRSGDLSSTGDGAMVLIRQFMFPLDYDENKDLKPQSDHDRLLQEFGNPIQKILRRYTGTGDMGLGSWLKSPAATDAKVIALIEEMMGTKKMQLYKGVVWTGYRVVGTVHRGNGAVVWGLELFCNRSGVAVYSDFNAPNVNKIKRGDRDTNYDNTISSFFSGKT